MSFSTQSISMTDLLPASYYILRCRIVLYCIFLYCITRGRVGLYRQYCCIKYLKENNASYYRYYGAVYHRPQYGNLRRCGWMCGCGSRYFLVQVSILIFAYVTTAQWCITKNSHKKERHYRRAGRALRHRFGNMLNPTQSFSFHSSTIS